MKKIILTIALFCASFGTAMAGNRANANVTTCVNDSVRTEQKVENVYAFTQRFYDIEKLEITNPANDSIIVFDDKMHVVYQSRKRNVELKLIPGNYIIASSKKIFSMYK